MFADMQVVVLDAESLAGPFSLIGDGPVRVEASPGLVVHVRTGTLSVRRIQDTDGHLVRAGRRFIARRAEPILMEPRGRTELRLEWTGQPEERLSPGLEVHAFQSHAQGAMEPFAVPARLGC